MTSEKIFLVRIKGDEEEIKDTLELLEDFIELTKKEIEIINRDLLREISHDFEYNYKDRTVIRKILIKKLELV